MQHMQVKPIACLLTTHLLSCSSASRFVQEPGALRRNATKNFFFSGMLLNTFPQLEFGCFKQYFVSVASVPATSSLHPQHCVHTLHLGQSILCLNPQLSHSPLKGMRCFNFLLTPCTPNVGWRRLVYMKAGRLVH